MHTNVNFRLGRKLWSRICGLDNTDSVEPPKKRSGQDTSNSKRSAIQEEVEEIHLKLKEKHADKYTPAQLRLGANMLQIGTHKDYNMPPDVPMFGGGKKRYEKHSQVVDALSGIAEGIVRALKPHSRTQSPTYASVGSQSTTTTSVGVSPGKQVQLRGQLITQIKQLHELLEAGAISLEEYNSQKASPVWRNFTACSFYLQCIYKLPFVGYHDVPQSPTQYVHREVKQK